MRSLIILEVEHGEDTDQLTTLAEFTTKAHTYFDDLNEIRVTNYSVRVDLPACFVLDSDS